MPATEAKPLYPLWPRQQQAMQLLGLGAYQNQEPVDELLFGGQAGGGKALALNTWIPTPGGLKKLADIHTGDLVFGSNGLPCVVLGESTPNLAEGWRLTFDDGSVIVAHDEHEWLTFTYNERSSVRNTDARYAERSSRRVSRVSGNKSNYFSVAIAERNKAEGLEKRRGVSEGSIRETQEIVNTLKVGAEQRTNHAVKVTSPLQLPTRDLPLDPYLLGVWLGDGTTCRGEITTMDPEIVEAFTSRGFAHTQPRGDGSRKSYGYYFPGLHHILASMGLLGNKRVPEKYIWASEEQRLALLQGMMDTDGCVEGACVAIGQKNIKIALAVALIARSLGMRVRIKKTMSDLYGKPCGYSYYMKFSANRILFRLPRKISAQKVSTRRTSHFRYIISAERASPTLMKCIEVSSADRLYLASENFIPTHNSYFLRALAVGLCLTYPGLVIPIFRRTYPELEETHIRKIQQELPPEAGKYKADSHEWHFPNGSVLEFRYCERDDDVYRYQSAEWDALFPDEATLFTEHQLRYLRTRVRSTRKGWRPIIVYTANPGGVGHHYIKSSFIDPVAPGQIFVDPETSKRKAFLKSRLSDNPALPAEYKRELEGLKDPALKRALLHGDWDIFAGQVFSEFRRDLHVIKPFNIPDHWVKWRAYDYGYGNPMCCLWFAKARGNRTTIVYRELYGAKMRDVDQAIKIKQLSKNENYSYSVADPAIWSKQPNGTSISEIFAGKGINFNKANNDRLSGWQRVHEYLTGEREEPELYIFETCVNLIRTLPTLTYDKNHVEDVDSDLEDHAADTLRYGLMGGSAAASGRARVFVQDFQVLAG